MCTVVINVKLISGSSFNGTICSLFPFVLSLTLVNLQPSIMTARRKEWTTMKLAKTSRSLFLYTELLFKILFNKILFRLPRSTLCYPCHSLDSEVQICGHDIVQETEISIILEYWIYSLDACRHARMHALSLFLPSPPSMYAHTHTSLLDNKSITSLMMSTNVRLLVSAKTVHKNDMFDFLQRQNYQP